MSEVGVVMDVAVEEAVKGNEMCCCVVDMKDPVVVEGLRNPWPGWWWVEDAGKKILGRLASWE